MHHCEMTILQVNLIDHMGSDLTVVNAARVSFDKESDWELTKIDDAPEWRAKRELTLSEKDRKLIKYLSSHGHWTPFSHVMIQMRETVPIFVARQRFKHMVGFTYNEVSRRYVDDEPKLFDPEEWRGKPINAKQGSSDEVINLNNYSWHDNPSGTGWDNWSIGEELNEAMTRILQTYRRMVEVGVAPEQARMVLPQSMYTSYYVTGSLAAWARAYNQRSDDHAQREIQDLAKMWDDNIRSITEVKHSWEALTNG